MSARDELFQVLSQSVTWVIGDAEENARNLIDDYAHELAEEIRARLSDAHGGFWDGLQAGANLIDPKVKK